VLVPTVIFADCPEIRPALPDPVLPSGSLVPVENRDQLLFASSYPS